MESTVISEKKKVGVKAYASLLFFVLFFSGLMPKIAALHENLFWLAAFDYSTLVGKFGALGSLLEDSGKLASNFAGTGGTGARDGFLQTLTIAPGVMFSMGVIKVCEHWGMIDAAERIFAPVCKVLFGVPGAAAVAVISSLTSTDAGPLLTNSLREEGRVSRKDQFILTAFYHSAAACVTNYFMLLAAFLPVMGISPLVPFAVILVMKCFGSNLMRIATNHNIVKVEEE